MLIIARVLKSFVWFPDFSKKFWIFPKYLFSMKIKLKVHKRFIKLLITLLFWHNVLKSFGLKFSPYLDLLELEWSY